MISPIAVERQLTVFEAHCLPNEHNFEVHDFADFQYGERLIRTTDGQEFALLTVNDDVGKELGEMLADIYQGRIDEMERARRFDKVFGLSCDPLNGKELDASVGILCPVCKASKVSYRDYKPPRFKSFLIPVISHENWLRMSKEERRALIEDGLLARDLL